MKQSQIRLGKAAEKIIDQAREQAGRRQATSVAPDYLLLALLEAKGNLALEILATVHVDAHQLRQSLEAQLPAGSDAFQTIPPLGEEIEQIIRYGMREAEHLGHSEINAAHLLMGLLYERNGLAYDLLMEAGVTLYNVREYILSHSKKFQSRALPQTKGVPLPSPIFLGLLAIFIGSGVALYLGAAPLMLAFEERGIAAVDVLKVVFLISGWVVSLCLHEFGHALAAYLGGDYSVKESGYLSLNPLKYTHPLFSIIMPIVLVVMGGIGLPGGAVYVNRQVLPSRGWHSLVSVAGPLGTLAFGLLILWPFFFGLPSFTLEHVSFWSALSDLALLQITALIFNLIPIPPLDGFGIVAPWLPDDIVAQAYRLGYLPFILFLFILWQGGPITHAFWGEVFRIADMLGIPYWL